MLHSYEFDFVGLLLYFRVLGTFKIKFTGPAKTTRFLSHVLHLQVGSFIDLQFWEGYKVSQH